MFFKVTIQVLLLSVLVWQVCGKVAPLVPPSYRSNAIQNKFNHNGELCTGCVNHTMSQAIYSSYELNILRTDTGAFENNIPSNVGGGNLVSSYIDFSTTPALNTFIEMSNPKTVSCQLYNASWLPPLPANFLQTMGATYAGASVQPYIGEVAGWSLLFPGTTLTFFFSLPSLTPAGWNLVAFDQSPGGQAQVGVTTAFFNYQPGQISPSVYTGQGSCSAFAGASDVPLPAPASLAQLVASSHPIHYQQALSYLLTPQQIAAIYQSI